MRVLRISHSATVRAWRGRERALRERGLDVRLLTATHSDAGGVPVALDADPQEDVVGVGTWGTHPALFVYDPRPLWRALGEHWDLIDIHEEPFALSTAEILVLRALRARRTPYILYTAQNLLKRYPFPFGWFERRSLRRAAGISACNAEAAAIAELKGFPGHARVIPLGVDPADEVDPAAGTAPADGTGSATAPSEPVRIVVGLLGRLVPEKGVLLLLDALVADPSLHARIAGTGPLAEVIEEEARRRGVGARVQFLGGVDPDDVAGFYASIDVLAVPSLPTRRWTEQFGRVAVEAMAAGVPVVSSDAGALPDVVGGAGIVVPRGDARALAAALREAAGPRRDELIARGLTRAAECSWPAIAAQYEQLYTAALASAPRGLPRTAARADEPEVIVVAYGAPDLLRRALEPVRHLPVTVVDNSSLPEIAALCDELGVRYRDPSRNLGFGAGVNRALAERIRPGADVLLLNPDAVIDADGVGALQRALAADPRLASVGPRQHDEQGVEARAAWVFPSPGRAWLEALGLGRLIRGPRFVIGSVLMLRAEALDQVGGFDERFFLYAEETDWAYRAHLLGWRHAVVPRAVATHAGGGTSTDPARRERQFHASQERYYRKHFGALGWASARAAQLLGATARGIALRGDRGRAAARRAALYRRGPVRAEAEADPRPLSA
ncbi:glycosyltransferase [Microbacterium azadirachtae]|uniref:glycosyltransferase n=1 Tax=Microbacterium azadirachtae TaxID=582680 RepID=UPI0021D4CD41|nr:glycosyltransferase [Microbacterium azadirachtae]UXW85209.1 glycosyltransferase [Microbacterium azadirachtae]